MERYAQFLRSVKELAEKEFESTHWGKAISAFDVYQYGGSPELSLQKIGEAVSESEFGFRTPKPTKFIWYTLQARMIRVLARLTRRLSDSRSRRYKHVRALTFLRATPYFDAYQMFIKKLGVGSDMQTVRHYYYARTLGKTFEQENFDPSGKTFLEVGSGAGNFAVVSFKLFAPKRYIIVDLPQMLAYAAYQVMRYAPEVEIVYPQEWSKERFAAATGPTLFCLTPAQLTELSEHSVDVILNFTSFTEMDRDEINRYFTELYRIGKSGSFFYNVNRWKKMNDREGHSYINNPFFLPYRADDVVLHWGLDEFHHRTRGGLDTIPTLTVARLARIKP